jgi:hypothetical protein
MQVQDIKNPPEKSGISDCLSSIVFRVHLKCKGFDLFRLTGLNQIPQIAIKVLEYGHDSIFFLGRWPNELYTPFNHFVVVPPEIICI